MRAKHAEKSLNQCCGSELASMRILIQLLKIIADPVKDPQTAFNEYLYTRSFLYGTDCDRGVVYGTQVLHGEFHHKNRILTLTILHDLIRLAV